MRRPLIFLALFSFALSAHAQRLFDDRAAISTWLQENKVPALGVGIIRDGKLREVNVYGHLQKDVPAPHDALWNVASLAKPIVSMLTLRLVAEGKWQLDEPLAKYWVDPDVAADPRHAKLTTRHVLTHRTGFANWRSMEESKKLTFHFEPGAETRYSGEGFEYLRRTLEKKFGKSLAELSKTYIFNVVGMPDTQQAWTARTDESRFARWHDAEGQNVYTDHKTTRVNAADDLITTVEDYGRFGAWVLSGASLPPALFTEMATPQGSMGLGWEVLIGLPNGEYALVHTGRDRGVTALIALLPKSGQGLVMMTNSDSSMRVFEKVVVESLDLGREMMKKGK